MICSEDSNVDVNVIDSSNKTMKLFDCVKEVLGDEEE